MSGDKDKSYNVALKAVSVLLLKNPERTVLGGVLGLALSFLFKLFSPALKSVSMINIQEASDYGWMAIGIILLYLPIIYDKLTKRPKINDEIDQVICLIEESNFSEPEKRNMYRELVNNILSTVSLQSTLRNQELKLQEKYENDAE